MKKKADIYIRSHQYIDGDVQRSESFYEGSAEWQDDYFGVAYTDDLGDGTVTDCLVELSGGVLSIKRSGGVNAVLEIVEGETRKASYITEFGEFDVSVTGKKTTLKTGNKKTELTAYYYLRFGSSEDILNKVSITAEYGDINNEQTCKDS